MMKYLLRFIAAVSHVSQFLTYLKYWTCFTTFSSGPNVDFEHTFVCLIAFCFIFFSVCYIFFFDETWECKEKCLDTLVFHKNFCSWSYVIFKKLLELFLRNFFKNLFGCWHLFTWLLKLTILDVYVRPWSLRDNSNGCWWNSDRTYI